MKSRYIVVLSALVLSLVTSSLAQKLKPEEIIAKHVESLGNADARAKLTSMIVSGTGTAKVVSSSEPEVSGRLVLASQGPKMFFGTNMSSPTYPGEQFLYDGNGTKFANARPGTRSTLATFVKSFDFLMKEGLLGGALTTNWMGLSPRGKLSSNGTKKINGRDAYVLTYSRKGGGDLDVTLYFDKETFQHVRTEYKRMSSASIGLRPEQSSGYDETRIKVTEDFGDFKVFSGLSMPTSYKILYSYSGQNGTFEYLSTFSIEEIAVGTPLDPATFNPS